MEGLRKGARSFVLKITWTKTNESDCGIASFIDRAFSPLTPRLIVHGASPHAGIKARLWRFQDIRMTHLRRASKARSRPSICDKELPKAQTQRSDCHKKALKARLYTSLGQRPRHKAKQMAKG